MGSFSLYQAGTSAILSKIDCFFGDFAHWVITKNDPYLAWVLFWQERLFGRG